MGARWTNPKADPYCWKKNFWNSMYQIVWTRLVHTQKTISPHTVAASVSILMRFRFSEKGILSFVISFSHLLSNRLRKFWLNGPKYERKPVASNTSPTSLEVNKPTNIHSNTFLYLTHIHQISKDFSARSKIIYERLRGRQRKMCKLHLNSSNQMTATHLIFGSYFSLSVVKPKIVIATKIWAKPVNITNSCTYFAVKPSAGK